MPGTSDEMQRSYVDLMTFALLLHAFRGKAAQFRVSGDAGRCRKSSKAAVAGATANSFAAEADVNIEVSEANLVAG